MNPKRRRALAEVPERERMNLDQRAVADFWGVSKDTVNKDPAAFGMVQVRSRIWRTSLARLERICEAKERAFRKSEFLATGGVA